MKTASTPLVSASALALFLLSVNLNAAAPAALPPPEETEYWNPVPTVVSAPAGQPPSDAVVLFDGKNLDAWVKADAAAQPAAWKIIDGALTPVAKAGDIASRAAFGDVQLHVEFRFAPDVRGKSQRRGNSGVFLMGLYEVQVLDSHENATYVNGQAGSIYKQHPPLVNPARAPGEWQTYDIVWIAPRFGADGGLLSPARLTVFFNGVLVQADAILAGPTVYRGKPAYTAHADKLPLRLQEHGNDSVEPVAFRNIWVRELKLSATP
ncbi:3-keto-disaccharide hydrolase [Oleiharenicola lentus]|uniref:3-keto-disaccharide hydrolase n=1 Tax=Oleiharenicola lentus TaxID=2508720 RepID=UPI003F6713D5